MKSEGPGLALLVVAVASRLVPRSARRSWRLEWEAELLARWQEVEGADGRTLAARLDLLARAAGSSVDAAAYALRSWRPHGLWRDVGLAARGLARRPGLSATVTLTLAIGIGSSAALFGVASDVLLRPFPYPEPEKLVALETHTVGRPAVSGNVSYPNVADVGEAATSLAGVAATRRWMPALEDDRASVVVRGTTATPGFFDVLGVEAGLGRLFGSGDSEIGARAPRAPVVLSHAFWSSHFGADPSVVGRDVRLDGQRYQVVGVTRADFEEPWLARGPGSETQVWRPVATPASEWPRSGRSWRALARVRSDVTLAAAQDEIDALFAGLVEAYPEANLNRAMRITPVRELVAGPARPVLLTLLGAVLVLLLIACANLANLLLGRALDRQGEFAVHRALGAPGWRVFNRAMAESAILAAAGGALGVALAVWLGQLATGLGPMLPRGVTGSVDLRVLLFALGVSGGAAALVGVGPALHAASGTAALPRREHGRGATSGRGGQRLRRGLVIGEVALTAALLVASGLLLRSFQRLGATDLGLEPEQIVRMDLHGSAWAGLASAAAQAQWDAVLESVRAVAGVSAAGAIDYVPLGGSFSCDLVVPLDRPPPVPGEGRCAEVRVVLPGALEAMSIPLVRGRLLDATDARDAPGAVVIDENLASSFWPGADPVGARLDVHGKVHEVVGIVGAIRHFGPAGVVRPMLYLHAPQEGWNGITRGLSVIARGSGGGALLPPMREAVQRVSASIAVGETGTLDDLLRVSLAEDSFRTILMAAFGVAALLLAALGLGGVMFFSVARRTRELGVRLALGAEPADVRALVLREGASLGLAGLTLGLAGAAGLSALIDGAVLGPLLFQTEVRDPLVYAGAAGVLAAAAALACYVPARRASEVDPAAALAVE